MCGKPCGKKIVFSAYGSKITAYHFPVLQDCDTRGGDRKWRDIDLDRIGWLRLHQI
jgi:hypothetical protein